MNNKNTKMQRYPSEKRVFRYKETQIQEIQKRSLKQKVESQHEIKSHVSQRKSRSPEIWRQQQKKVQNSEERQEIFQPQKIQKDFNQLPSLNRFFASNDSL